MPSMHLINHSSAVLPYCTLLLQNTRRLSQLLKKDLTLLKDKCMITSKFKIFSSRWQIFFLCEILIIRSMQDTQNWSSQVLTANHWISEAYQIQYVSSSLTECDSLFDGESNWKLFARMWTSVKLIPNDINASPITKHRVQSNVIRRLDLFVAFNGLLGWERPRPQVFLLGISNNFFHVYLINKTHKFFF